MLRMLPLAEVWTQTLRPMSRFHGIVAKRTQCEIPLMGFGFTRTFAAALRDLCHPCPRCFHEDDPGGSSVEDAT